MSSHTIHTTHVYIDFGYIHAIETILIHTPRQLSIIHTYIHTTVDTTVHVCIKQNTVHSFIHSLTHSLIHTCMQLYQYIQAHSSLRHLGRQVCLCSSLLPLLLCAEINERHVAVLRDEMRTLRPTTTTTLRMKLITCTHSMLEVTAITIHHHENDVFVSDPILSYFKASI